MSITSGRARSALSAAERVTEVRKGGRGSLYWFGGAGGRITLAERHNPGQSDHGAGLPGDVSARPSRDVRMTP